ncbi:centrosomal protein of 95 kDa [Discoglossus pictus]
MGTEERGWVSVANNLLNKCHINLQVRNVNECDAHIFVALYEAILGEKVPDFIPEPQSQEDDAHNVQSVVDSLALDYLQVSLSHITGENIVRGDTESIKNILEIFDGLLEYLTEQISEASSQNGDDLDSFKDFHPRLQHEEIRNGQKDSMPTLRPPQSAGSSSDLFVPSWEVDGSESTGELIRLGETAHTFILRGSDSKQLKLSHKDGTEQPKVLDNRHRASESPPGVARHEVEDANERPSVVNGFSVDHSTRSIQRPLPQDTPSAIPLHLPYQPRDTRPLTANEDVRISTMKPSANGIDTSGTDSRHETNLDQRVLKSPDRTSLRKVVNGTTAPATAETSISSSQKKVAFRTLPDIRFMTLRSKMNDKEDWPSGSDEEESVDPGSSTITNEDHTTMLSEGSILDSRRSDTLPVSITEEPLSVQRARNKLSELELQEMSEKLARRLDELDLMLKKALGDQAGDGEPKEEDKLSQHSDSIMEFRRKKQLQAAQHPKKLPSRPRSLSSSPPPLAPPRLTVCSQFEDALHKEAKGETGKIRREIQKEMDLQRMKSHMLTKAYEDELKDFEEKERIKLSKLKAKLKKTEQECKENILKEPPKTSQPQKVYTVKQVPQTPKPGRGFSNRIKPRKPAPMKIKDNDLLPLLLDEFPYLQISPHTLNKMWKGQVAQMEQLSRSAQEDDRSEKKLQNEVQEAHKKHDLLVDIIRKEQGHNQRLKDFKERIRLQKSAQNKMRDNRQLVARANKYYEDYHVQLRAKLMRARTREERVFKKLFEEGLELQKQRLREIRSYTKEQREEQRKRHKDELESMENYYKDQFSMLAETVSQERHEIQAREKSQSKTLHKMKRELRAKMEKEIQELQDMIIKTDEDTFFRELEAEQLKRRLQMASFQYGKSHCL